MLGPNKLYLLLHEPNLLIKNALEHTFEKKTKNIIGILTSDNDLLTADLARQYSQHLVLCVVGSENGCALVQDVFRLAHDAKVIAFSPDRSEGELLKAAGIAYYHRTEEVGRMVEFCADCLAYVLRSID